MISSPIAELCPRFPEPAWFCIRSQLKREHIAAAHLRLLPEVDVFNPRLRLLRSTRRGSVWSSESLFPNYLFARFALDSKLEKVRYTPSVKTVVQFGAEVPSIPDAVIQQLQCDLGEMRSKVLVEAPEEGEEVEVGEGAFKGLNGRVTHVLPAKRRVQVLLDFMGRSVAAEVSLGALLFRRRNAANLVLQESETISRLGAHLSFQICSPELLRPSEQNSSPQACAA
ncbi:MAG TPA: transcription termination/antitermination NusG family protein [Candidatus Paceibacterota bacterium]|nr:transcription termination/antitermination NusG family protein [Verrucomicrobiota bacterium]HSA08809.1 transcription termination/antitermination NusG family protein [Candidatus Paceibacterota bacterium]